MRTKKKRHWQDTLIIDLDKLEIVAADLKYCGPYDPKLIKNQTIAFRDDRHGKNCHVRFQDGKIFLSERAS